MSENFAYPNFYLGFLASPSSSSSWIRDYSETDAEIISEFGLEDEDDTEPVEVSTRDYTETDGLQDEDTEPVEVPTRDYFEMGAVMIDEFQDDDMSEEVEVPTAATSKSKSTNRNRFPQLTVDDVNNLLVDATSKRTKQMTRCHVKIFKGKLIIIVIPSITIIHFFSHASKLLLFGKNLILFSRTYDFAQK